MSAPGLSYDFPPGQFGSVAAINSVPDWLEVDLAVEVREDYAVAAHFALVVMDLCRSRRIPARLSAVRLPGQYA